MFNRVELKERAKKILKRNYGWAILVSFILSIVLGGSGVGNITNVVSNNTETENSIADDFFGYDDYEEFKHYYLEDYVDPIYDYGMQYEDESILEEILLKLRNVFKKLPFNYMDVIKAFVVVVSIMIIFGILLNIFVVAPLEVGCRRWFVKNRTVNPNLSELAHAFSNGYLNTVKVMFLRNLYICGWTLLFIIPGIIKSYEYMMVPYLLAENPNMSSSEAFARSKSMMRGNKWAAFVLSLSFIGWEILAIFTCGILGLLWVNPYRYCTDTELYVELCLFKNNTPNNGNSTYNNNQTNNNYSEQKGIDHEMFK